MKGMAAILFLTLVAADLGKQAEAANAKHGKQLFQTRGCVTCHGDGAQGSPSGPNLVGVTKLRKKDWLKRWIKDPDSMRDDPVIKQFENKYPAPMPAAGLSDKEVADIIAYLAEASASPHPESSNQPGMHHMMHGHRGGMMHDEETGKSKSPPENQ